VGPSDKYISRLQANEIRLCWSDDIAKDDEQLTVMGLPVHPGSGVWHPDTTGNRWTLEQVMEAGNETYAPGTHWIEEKRETTRRRSALKDLMQNGPDKFNKNNCRALGDAYFAVMCPPGSHVITTNLVDHAPLCNALGKTAVNPTRAA
jgi:hypothetical protein